MSDSQSVRARPVRRQRSRRQWSRLAVVFTTMVILFGVPWWTLLAAGTGWPTGWWWPGRVFVTAFVGVARDDDVGARPPAPGLGRHDR